MTQKIYSDSLKILTIWCVSIFYICPLGAEELSNEQVQVAAYNIKWTNDMFIQYKKKCKEQNTFDEQKILEFLINKFDNLSYEELEDMLIPKKLNNIIDADAENQIRRIQEESIRNILHDYIKINNIIDAEELEDMFIPKNAENQIKRVHEKSIQNNLHDYIDVEDFTMVLDEVIKYQDQYKRRTEIIRDYAIELLQNDYANKKMCSYKETIMCKLVGLINNIDVLKHRGECNLDNECVLEYMDNDGKWTNKKYKFYNNPDPFTATIFRAKDTEDYKLFDLNSIYNIVYVE
ncbi:uncharacterized protein LOC126897683 isoform X2 [Daktulosphaira vitifoliae]|uniref:uncharacterized protein LOC126897683 isoform X2 n=1 Tax=Daktulosphaira vitifoliae TaxID=58002 RepID=UPI0021AB030C|nr:uncharacterized protein LOC126897683 isoform X2 [Daktulosphaira vitifoliae]